MLKKIIGIIGYGNMGSAIAQRIQTKYKILVFDTEQSKINSLPKYIVAGSIKGLVEKSDIIILAVKPQDFYSVLQEIGNGIKDKLVISIAAGITTSYIEKILQGVRVIRTMPNLPAKVGAGVTCLYKGKYAVAQDLKFCAGLFRRLGKTIILNDEEMLNAATAVSGSGPGFLCELVEGKTLPQIKDFTENEFIPSLTATASSLGFTPIQAKILAEETGRGTVKYLKAVHLLPEKAKKQVVSKKGTTEAGLKKLKYSIANLTAAAKAALKRSKELSKK